MCEYCTLEPNISAESLLNYRRSHGVTAIHEIGIPGKNNVIDCTVYIDKIPPIDFRIPINYCPMCGRKLGDSDA